MNVIQGLGALVVSLCLSLLAVGCTTSSAPPTDRVCDRIPADAGGCSPDRPVFTGTTCRDLAVEWGRAVDAGLLKVLDQPKEVDGKAWSVRISDTIILATIAVGLHMRDVGIAESCDTPEFLPAAREQFSKALDDRILTGLFDGEPATEADWDVVLHRYVDVLDDDSPGASLPAEPT